MAPRLENTQGGGADGSRKAGRLTRRAEFLAVAGSRRKWATAGVIVQARAHDDRQRPAHADTTLRLGFTASRKVGGAVERNRARRRLKAAAAEIAVPNTRPGHDLVLIARGETVRRPFALIKADLVEALTRLKLWREAGDPGKAGT